MKTLKKIICVIGLLLSLVITIGSYGDTDMFVISIISLCGWAGYFIELFSKEELI